MEYILLGVAILASGAYLVIALALLRCQPSISFDGLPDQEQNHDDPRAGYR